MTIEVLYLPNNFYTPPKKNKFLATPLMLPMCTVMSGMVTAI